MAKIVFSMSGEGRGHAARVRALVERLRFRHEITLLAPDQAYDFLKTCYGRDEPTVKLVRIPGLRFHYTDGRLNLHKSTRSAIAYMRDLPQITARVKRVLRQVKPDLAVCDFEPALPRAARQCDVPLLAINHQHFSLAYDLSCLPRRLQWHAWGIGQVARLHHRHQAATVVSAFFRPPLRPGWEDTTQVGPLLRPEIRRQRPENRGFLLSYLRPFTPSHVIEALVRCGREVRIYGLGTKPSHGKVRFLAIDQDSYSKDLAACAAYVGAAGNQTLGELLYYGKPVLALPERKHHEQRINAHFVRQMGVGESVVLEDATDEDLTTFLDRLGRYREKLASYQGQLDGTATTLSVIKSFLPEEPATSDLPTLPDDQLVTASPRG